MTYADTGMVAVKRQKQAKKYIYQQRQQRVHTTEGNRLHRISSVNSLNAETNNKAHYKTTLLPEGSVTSVITICYLKCPLFNKK